MTAKTTFLEFADQWFTPGYRGFMHERLDAALDEARAEGERIGAEKQMERDCKAICQLISDRRRTTHQNPAVGDFEQAIRRAWAEQQKGTEAEGGQGG